MIWASGLEGASQKVKVREVMKIIEADGWYLLKMEGDHRQFKHQTKKGRVTIAGHPSKEVPQVP
jgi:predicted RNA binding protein YcfA (HicA-like mRNA interferase family)